MRGSLRPVITLHGCLGMVLEGGEGLGLIAARISREGDTIRKITWKVGGEDRRSVYQKVQISY